MIDRAARDQLAELLRHLVCGQMTNDDFDDAADRLSWKSPDRGVKEVYGVASGLYNDFSTYRLRGKRRVTEEQRRQMAIAAMFLYSGREYEWPRFRGPSRLADYALLFATIVALFVWHGCVLSFSVAITAGHWTVSAMLLLPMIGSTAGTIWLYRTSKVCNERAYRRWREKMNRLGDFDVWPFLRQADFDAQRKFPRLLTGIPARSASEGTQ